MKLLVVKCHVVIKNIWKLCLQLSIFFFIFKSRKKRVRVYTNLDIRLISDVIESYEKKTCQVCYFSLILKELFKVLEVMNFGPMFRKWIHTFYCNIEANITSCVMNNGHASDFFHLRRGVRQGWPLSRLLFVSAIEVLAQAIRQNENIRGFKINGIELKLSMYADDLTAVIKDECSANHLFKLINDFGTCSGLKINISKTEGMWLCKSKPLLRYELPFKVTMENKLRCFQYKVIHDILPTNNKLYKMKLKASPSCDRCNHPYENLLHLLYECPRIQNFLANGNRLVERKAIGNCRFKCHRYFIWV